MATNFKTITLNEDHLRLIEAIKFEKFIFDNNNEASRFGWGIDQYSLWGGTYAMEDIALIIGKFDQYIRGTEEDPLGRQFPTELEDYMWGLYHDIWDNMEYIISLVLYYSNKGGLSVGTYKCKKTDKVWTKTE